MKFLKIVGNIVLWVAAIMGVVVIGVATLSHFNVIKPLIVATGSMSPTFEAGSLIISKTTPATEMKPGDIVTVPRELDGALVTHRAIEIVGTRGEVTQFRMQGDANDVPDAEVYEAESYGKPLIIVPELGNVVNSLSNFRFLALATIVTVVLLIVIWSPSKKDDDKII